MAGDPFKPVRPRQKLQIHAAAWNEVLKVAKDRNSDPARTLPGQLAARGREAGIVLVHNDSGAAVDRFGVLGIASPIATPTLDLELFAYQFAVTGVEPTTDHRGRFVVLLQPLEDGGVGYGVLDGLAPVLVKMNDEGHLFADVIDGDATMLGSAEYGSACLLWVQAEGDRDVSDEALCLARIGIAQDQEEFSAKLTGYTSIGSLQWAYSWEEYIQDGMGGWAAKTGGRNSTADGTARNLYEAFNTGSGTQGNGYDPADLPGTYAIGPVGLGTSLIVRMKPPCGEGHYHTFGVPNPIPGAC